MLTERKKLAIYKTLLFLLAFVVAFLPSTATRSHEVNSRVIVEMLGIDATDTGETEVTAQYVMPSGSDGETSKDKLTVTADNITQAVEQLNTSLGRRAEIGHCSIVIMGDGAQPDTLGTLMTATDITADVYLCAASGKAKDLIGDLTDFMTKTGATDADFIAYGTRKSHVATNTLLGFLSDLGSASQSAYIPVVEILKDGSGEASGSGDSGGSGSSGGSAGGGSGGESGGGSGMKVEKLALYGRDGRLGVISRTAARGVAWASAPVVNSVVTADVDEGGKPGCMSGKLIRKSSAVKIDGPARTATVEVSATVEPNCNTFNRIESAAEPGMTDKVRNAFAESIREELSAAYADSLALGADPMFILRQFYRYAPDEDLSLGDIEVSFKVNVKLN